MDYSCIAAHLDGLMRDYAVEYICADKWRIEFLAALMDAEVTEKKIITIPQTIEGMSPAMKELDRMFHEHDKNPCGRWCFGNVVIAMDGNENIKPHKGRSIDRIDPIVALINAMAAALRLEKKRSIYEGRGLRML